ncbi:ferredoxin-type protein [Leminorella richardii]|uniref:Ferredoxin-type protein NapF n=1 Tax=Leminorella richardii TaxID=158841 RepID=A0A2X4UBD6_9GAMM|nr:ferredoxin-type protein NapF [Leminorella richardii]SQI37127.1 ferredoxin-type protein [Leminorella richardii]
MSTLSRRNLLRGHWRTGASAVRPPWSVDDARFVDGCTRCGACVEACETGVLTLAGRLDFPELDFQRAECTFCRRCVEACPEPIFRRHDNLPWRRTAVISESCLTVKGVACRSCQDVCEPYAIQFRLYPGGIARPQLDADTCTGCGGCVKSCPVGAITTRESNKENDEIA